MVLSSNSDFEKLNKNYCGMQVAHVWKQISGNSVLIKLPLTLGLVKGWYSVLRKVRNRSRLKICC